MVDLKTLFENTEAIQPIVCRKRVRHKMDKNSTTVSVLSIAQWAVRSADRNPKCISEFKFRLKQTHVRSNGHGNFSHSEGDCCLYILGENKNFSFTHLIFHKTALCQLSTAV